MLTGYSDPDVEHPHPLEVFWVDPNDGTVLGGPISIAEPARSDSDGFAVLPNGNFLINDFDGAEGCTVYREYYSSGPNGGQLRDPVDGGLEIDLGPYHFSQARGVALAPDGQSIYFVAAMQSEVAVDVLVQTDLAGNLVTFQAITPTQLEDIDIVVP